MWRGRRGAGGLRAVSACGCSHGPRSAAQRTVGLSTAGDRSARAPARASFSVHASRVVWPHRTARPAFSACEMCVAMPCTVGHANRDATCFFFWTVAAWQPSNVRLLRVEDIALGVAETVTQMNEAEKMLSNFTVSTILVCQTKPHTLVIVRSLIECNHLESSVENATKVLSKTSTNGRTDSQAHKARQ